MLSFSPLASAPLGDAAAVALIDATSTRAIAFGLDALAQVALVASSAGSASYSLATTAAERSFGVT